MSDSENIFDFSMYEDAPKLQQKPEEQQLQKTQTGAMPRFFANVVALCAAAAVLPFLAHLIWIIGQWSWGLLS